MSKTKEEYEKMLIETSSIMERFLGMRLLTTFQCILCGIIIDDVDIAIDYIECCPKKKKD